MDKTELDRDKQQRLLAQIEAFIKTFWRLHRRAALIGNCLTAFSLLLAGGVSLVGFLGYGKLAGVMGAAITVLIGFQRAFNFPEKADFYHIIHNEAKVLRDRVRYKVSSNEQLGDAVDDLGMLRNHAARKLPKGTGIETVVEMRASSRRQAKR